MPEVDDAWLRAAGTSPAAIGHHYDLPPAFFARWLGPDLVYSCARWDPADPHDTLERAQRRKLDVLAGRLGVAGGHVLDVGCGWGALLRRFAAAHGLASGVGLTLSASQHAHALTSAGTGTEEGAGTGAGARLDYRLESWVDHRPQRPYDAITCIEMTEHLAHDGLGQRDKVAVYTAFFDRCAAWLVDGGRLGLQLICLDNVGHEGSRSGRGPLSELVRTQIFPESMPASLGELAVAWEPSFSLDVFEEHSAHYRRTFRAWGSAARSHAVEIRSLLGEEQAAAFRRYFAVGEIIFGRREQALYRVVLTKRHRPKPWAAAPTPARSGSGPGVGGVVARTGEGPAGASASAVRAHYDLSNEFYRLWLGPTMSYSSGLWPGDAPGGTGDAAAGPAGSARSGELGGSAGSIGRLGLAEAAVAKMDAFLDWVVPDGVDGCRVLDVGCGWGGALRRLARRRPGSDAVGLTLSVAQAEHLAAAPIPRSEIRLEAWEDHRPRAPYDAIVSFGAFEHFARDGSSHAERVAAYRRFFAAAHGWLVAGGRLGLETIAHDDAPDTAVRRGRGPLGDTVLELFPESLCPHLCEVVLGFEPYFEVEQLRSDAADFARTFRHWLLALRGHEEEAAALVGDQVVARWRRYLVASELQFRLGLITNLRLVLRRRPSERR